MILAGQPVQFGQRTLVMGILNLTPDSFAGDGLAGDVTAAVAQARQFVADGADLLDLGGESTRPGAAEVTVDQELARVVPVLRAVRQAVDVPLSVDTRRAAVAAAALQAGADLVNDVTGLTGDPAMAGVVAAAGVPVVLQHIQGTPQTMQADPRYEDVVEDVRRGLAERLALAAAAGIAREQCLLDPGIGFGKRLEHNLRLLRRLGELQTLGCPLLVGPSRKSFLGQILDLPVHERLEGTAAAVAWCVAQGVAVVRVHDVRAMVRVVRVCDAIRVGA
ncbi:MAG: dihydropteroate synthase [Fimbriimonadaceae bacterium]|nr:dihydropteroate synthase [Fimbriimonadaceae bacterium]